MVASSARADRMADAKDLFTRGRELRTRGDCANAVAMFRKAYELYPAALGSLRNLAECEESLGRYASARRAWVDLKRALLGNSDPKYDGWSQDSEQAAARLAPKLATLTIDVNVVAPGGETAPAEGVDVTLDGEKLAPAQIGTPLERDPGRHVVRVAGAHVAQPQERLVDLASSDAKRVALRVVVNGGTETSASGATPGTMSTPAQSSQEKPEAATETALATRRTWGWVGVGVGAAAAIGFGVSLFVRQSALDDLNGSCPQHPQCDSSQRGTVDPIVSRGQTASTLATVFAVVGGLALSSGFVLLATSFGHGQNAALVLQPASGGASGLWTF
jgi:hypothetical protein